MSEEAIDPAQRVAQFYKPDDVAFAVELENGSDQPIKLFDTRYDENFGKSKGEAGSDWFGQVLFSGAIKGNAARFLPFDPRPTSPLCVVRIECVPTVREAFPRIRGPTALGSRKAGQSRFDAARFAIARRAGVGGDERGGD